MLIQGENTYSTALEADEYINSYYTKYAPLRVIWSVLDEDEKEGYLRTSLAEIEALPFVGRKVRVDQKIAFPRLKQNVGLGYAYPYGAFFGGMADFAEIPQEVKQAQAENAFAVIGKECAAQTNMQFITMQSLGVVKNIKFNKRDSFDVGAAGVTGTPEATNSKLTSAAAEKMLRGWLGALRC